MTKPCVIFLANRAYALSNSRLSLIKHFIEKHWQVVLATGEDDQSRIICELGAELETVRFHRGGFSPLTDFRAYRRLWHIFQTWSPTLIHNFHAKPVIIGSLVAGKCNVHPCVVNTITGLGHAFVMGGLTAKIAGRGYKTALPHADCTIFQNRDDLELFLDKKWVTRDRTRFIASSGVDTDRFSPTHKNESSQRPPTIVMIGRLLKQKGIQEFAAVARHIQKRLPQARFMLAGEEDPIHPDAIDKSWLESQTHIDYVGRLQDVVPFLDDSDVLLFPSYREGVPRVVLEAAAMGTPTVAFDVPGVREAVIDGETGFLVPHLDIDALTHHVSLLLDDASLRNRMGIAARNMVERQFDIRSIQEQYLDVYRSLGIRV